MTVLATNRPRARTRAEASARTAVAFACVAILALFPRKAESAPPDRGVMAHRGASLTHPENTVAAVREAVRLGAHAIEVDVQRTADGHLVLMHDGTVDRTTNGAGKVADMTLEAIRALDAGSWKNLAFAGEKVPTVAEAVAAVPRHIWLNLDLKAYDSELGRLATEEVIRLGHLDHVFLSVKTDVQRDAARGAAARAGAGAEITLNNMIGQSIATNWIYAKATATGGYKFLQFASFSAPAEILHPSEAVRKLLEGADVNIAYYASSLLGEIRTNPTKRGALRDLYVAGVDFQLVDDVAGALEVLAEPQR